MKSVMGTYRREKSREKQSLLTRSGMGSVYVSKWSAFAYFDFLSDCDSPSQTVDTLNEQELNGSTQEELDINALQISDTSQTTGEILTESLSAYQKTFSDSVQRPSMEAKKKKRTTSNYSTVEDLMLNKAFTLLQKSIDINLDSYFTYGLYITRELRKYDQKTLTNVKQAINNIIFDADVGHLSFSKYEYYWQPHERWASYEEQIHPRPTRVRAGNGRYRLLPVGAELMCDFPQSLVIVSNVVWERADLGDRSSLNQLYHFHGLPHEFSVHTRPYGSTLHLFQVTPLDRGLYRCMVSAVDPSSSNIKPLTFFQDVDFYPEA